MNTPLLDTEVILSDPKNDFLKIAETLTRIGIQKGSTITQVAYILHKRGRYFIIHSEQLKQLDIDVHEDDLELLEKDLNHLKKVLALLNYWSLASPVKPLKNVPQGLDGLAIINCHDKDKWNLISPCDIGKIKKIDKEPALY